MKTFIFIFHIALAALITSCDANYMPEGEERMVVEGWIDNGGFPVVILTKNIVLSKDYQESDTLFSHIIRWAKITVSDGEKSVVLTGKYDSRYFPPYIYTTSYMRGETGRTYSLDVEYRDFHATATTTIPDTHHIEKLTVQPCAQSDTLYQVSIGINADKAKGEYFQIFTREGRNDRLFTTSYLGTLDGDALKNGCEIPVYRSHRVTSRKKYSPYFSANDTIPVKLAHIDKESYIFWSDYSRNLTLAGNLFMAPAHNIRTNVDGAIGYWCGMGSDIRYIAIKDYISGR